MTCTLCGSINHKTPDCAWRPPKHSIKEASMGKYVVAYVTFHDNDLTQEVVEANSSVEAITRRLKSEGWDLDSWPSDEDDLKQLAFDSDALVSAIKIYS